MLKKTHCIKGHKFSGTNKRGKHICHLCLANNTKKYNRHNKEKVKIKQQEWRTRNREHVISYQNSYNINNRIKRLAYAKEYRRQNSDVIKEKRKQYDRQYRQNRMKYDPIYRLSRYLRTRLNKAVKNQYTKKTDKVCTLTGCTIQELRAHLERQFCDGMSWENYSKKGWHVDHIKPCASFNLTVPEKQKKCFHYTNLQPLWWYDNQSKHAKISYSSRSFLATGTTF